MLQNCIHMTAFAFLLLGAAAAAYLWEEALWVADRFSSMLYPTLYDSSNQDHDPSSSSSSSSDRLVRSPGLGLSKYVVEQPVMDYRSPCDMDLKRFNSNCPRFIYRNTRSPGLGDHVFQLLVENVFALDSQGRCVIWPLKMHRMATGSPKPFSFENQQTNSHRFI